MSRDGAGPKATPPETAKAIRDRARKRAAAGAAQPVAPKAAAPKVAAAPLRALRPTTIEGVFLNRAGVHVDSRGVALSFRELKERDEAHFADVLGTPAATPAELLKAVALDPRQPFACRIDAAKAAAPYFTPKRVAVQGGGADAPPLDVRASVESMTAEQLNEFEQLNARMAEMLAQVAAANGR